MSFNEAIAVSWWSGAIAVMAGLALGWHLSPARRYSRRERVIDAIMAALIAFGTYLAIIVRSLEVAG